MSALCTWQGIFSPKKTYTLSFIRDFLLYTFCTRCVMYRRRRSIAVVVVTKLHHMRPLSKINFLQKYLRMLLMQKYYGFLTSRFCSYELIVFISPSEAQIRFLKAKARVMQEEMEKFSSELAQEREDNSKLVSRIKELEDERNKLAR